MERLPGFRDFYPEPLPPTKDELWSMDARNHIFDTWRAVARRYGFRELREETGYEGRDALLLAQVWSNPAIMNNRTYTVLVENCELKHPTEFDSGEDLTTRRGRSTARE